MSQPTNHILPPGHLLQGGKYRIVSLIAQGGFGITYEAIQTGLNARVALKEFYIKDLCLRDINDGPDVMIKSTDRKAIFDGFRQKFLKEARTIASLSHHNIVKVNDVFEQNGTAYYTMEYIEGETLKDHVAANGPLEESRAIELIAEAGEALSHIHSRNILHLDIKPDNIMLRNGTTPVIIDFGVSKRYDKDGNQTSMMQIARSRGYAPIEQYKPEAMASFSPATDVYSLAATLYFALSGDKPLEPSQIFEHGLPLILDISGETMEAIIKGMAVKRENRPQSVDEFIDLLEGRGTSENPAPANGSKLTESLVNILLVISIAVATFMLFIYLF